MSLGDAREPSTQPRQFPLSAFWFAVNLHWGVLLIIVIPSEMRRIVPSDPAAVQGLVLGLGAVPAVVVPLIVGVLSDRCASPLGRRRPFMITGVGVNLAGLALMAWASASSSLPLFVAAYFVTNVGNNIATGAYSGMIPDLVPPERRGLASGWMAAMTQLGTIVGVVAGGFLVGARLLGLTYGLLGGLLALFLLITCLGVRETPVTSPRDPLNWAELGRRFWVDPRKHPDFAWVWITRFLVVMGLWGVQQFMQYYLADVIGVPAERVEATTGMILGLGLVCATISGVLGGRLSDRVGRKRVVYVANGIVAACAVAFLFGHSIAYVLAVVVVFGLAYGAYYSVDWALGCDVLPDSDAFGSHMAVWHVSMVLPQALALPLSGWLLGAVGGVIPGAEGHAVSYSFAGYIAIFSVSAFFLALGAVLLRNVRGVR